MTLTYLEREPERLLHYKLSLISYTPMTNNDLVFYERNYSDFRYTWSYEYNVYATYVLVTEMSDTPVLMSSAISDDIVALFDVTLLRII
jgi:hypothetical protein